MKGKRWEAELLEFYIEAGETAKALDLALELLRTARAERPKGSPELADELADVGAALVRIGSPVLAETPLRESMAIRGRTRPDSWSTFSSRSLVGAALLGQKRFAEAEPFLVSGYEGLKSRRDEVPWVDRARLAEAGAWVVQLYESWERPALAGPWRIKTRPEPDEGWPDDPWAPD